MNAINTWRPSASLDSIKKRACLMSKIRSFFTSRNFLEVETPVLSSFGVTDLYLRNMETKFSGETYYLQTSPEYHMKRLLAAGCESIFQLARVFRDDECGRWHNPEFTLLEWYQLDVDHHQLMSQMDLLLQELLGCKSKRRVTYQQIFQDVCQIDVLNSDVAELRQVCQRYDLNNVFSPEETDKDLYLFLLMSHVIEKSLVNEENPVAIYDYPASQASLAQIHGDVASRFEVYVHGVELANGFHELTDPKIQRERFNHELNLRALSGLPAMAIDHNLLAAMEHGLPACSGVALGVDRLCALMLNTTSISEILAFDFPRA